MTASAQTYLKARAGLGDLPARLRDRAGTIAYMGASVTAQRDGYRPRLHELIRQATGHEHRSIAAGLGATGAITGVFMMDELVLRHAPDLAFVEYATSDIVGTTSLRHLEATVEGIVGKLRNANCALCFLYLHRSDVSLGTSPVVEAYERVAERHGVPSINVAEWIRAAIADGRLDGEKVLRDPVHTTSEGSILTAGLIAAALARIPVAPIPAPVMLADDGFADARLETPTGEIAVGDYVESRFRLVYPTIEIDSSGSLCFTAPGELVGLLIVVGPHSGSIEVAAGGSVTDYLLWDDECSYERLSAVILDPFVPAGVQVTIRVMDTPVDYSSARRPIDPERAARKQLKLAGLMVKP